MATFTIADLRDFEHRYAPWWIPIISSATSTGTATTIPDTALMQDTGGVILSANLPAGVWVYRPAATAGADRQRRLGTTTPLTVATGVLTHSGANYTGNIANGDLYEIHTIQPRITFDILLSTMRRLLMPFHAPLERFTNAACQSATGWSVSGAGSVTVVTAAANVQDGINALFFNAGTAGEYLKGTTFRVTPSTTYFVSANYRLDAGGPGILALWDETNDVEIQNSGRVSHSLEQFTTMQRIFSTPATCEEASVRTYATNATDDIYVAGVNGPWSPDDRIIDLPSWATRANAIRKVQTASYTLPVPSVSGGYNSYSRAYDPPLRLRQDYGVRIVHPAANPYRIELDRYLRLPDRERWLEALRPASDFTTWVFTAAGETSPTCALPLELVGMSHIRDVCLYSLENNPDDGPVNATLDRLLGPPKGRRGERTGGDLTDAMRDFLSDMEVPAPYSRTYWFNRGI